MQNLDHQSNSQQNKNSRIYTKRHHEIIDALERLLEQGVPELTMSEIAKKLKISLRTLYEIAPSRDKLILMTMDNILKKLGKFAMDSVEDIDSPINKFLITSSMPQTYPAKTAKKKPPKGKRIFEASNILLPFGGFFLAVFAGYVWGIDEVIRNLLIGESISSTESIANFPNFLRILSIVIKINLSLLGAISYSVLNEIFSFLAISDIVNSGTPCSSNLSRASIISWCLFV